LLEGLYEARAMVIGVLFTAFGKTPVLVPTIKDITTRLVYLEIGCIDMRSTATASQTGDKS
jgi:hypothetical protein